MTRDTIIHRGKPGPTSPLGKHITCPHCASVFAISPSTTLYHSPRKPSQYQLACPVCRATLAIDLGEPTRELSEVADPISAWRD